MGMHAAQPPVELLGQTPRLAAVEGVRMNDRLDESPATLVDYSSTDRLFGFVL